MSLHRASVLFPWPIFLLGLLGVALSASAQYPGQVSKKSKDTVELRSIGVLEWTGEAGKPKASRLVPVTVYDGTTLQDGMCIWHVPTQLAVARDRV